MGTGQQESSGLLDDLSGSRIGVVQNYIAIGIGDPGVQLRGDISTAVGNSCVGTSQFVRSNTVGQTAQSQGLVHVGLDLVADLHTVGQSGKSKVQQIIITKSRSNHRDVLNCDDIQGITDRTSDILDAPVTGPVPVTDGSTVGIVKRCIVVYSTRVLPALSRAGA